MTDGDGSIVVGVDGSAAGVHAVRWAARAASARKTGLQVVHAIGTFEGYGAGREVVKTAAAAARQEDEGLDVRCITPMQSPGSALLEAAETARMVVLGAGGSGGFAGMLVGSTVLGVAGRAPCHVAVTRGGGPGVTADGPVVAGVHGAQVGEHVLASAFDEAATSGANLVVLHALEDPDAGPDKADEQRQALADRVAGWQQKYPDVPVQLDVTGERARQSLLDWSGRARLVVVGSRGMAGLRGMLLGSTSQALLQHAQCPVLVVH